MNVYKKFLKITFNDLTQDITFNLDSATNKVTLVTKAGNNVTGVLPVGYIKNPDAADADITLNAGEGIVVGNDNSINVDTDFLESFVANLGYVKTDNDTLYHADLVTLNIDGSNTFSINQTWLNNFIDAKGFLTEHQSLSAYALKSELPVVPSKLSELEDDLLSAYLLKEDYEDKDTVYTAGNGLSLSGTEFEVKIDLASEGFLSVGASGLKVTGIQAAIDTAVSGLATEQFVLDKIEELDKDTVYEAGEGIKIEDGVVSLTATIPSRVGELTNDKSYVTVADLEAVKFSILEQLGNIVSIVSIDSTSVGNAGENLFVETDTQVTNNTVFTGKNITVTELSNKNSYSRFVSDGDISISKLSSEGTLVKNATNGNGQVLINTSGRVVITESDLQQNGYNAVEIGGSALPQSVLIDHVIFGGTLSNNTISIYGTAEDAVITISNCEFVNCSNPIRISNRTGAHVTINLVNCTFGDWESARPQWGGIFCCQDYTSTTAAAAMENNLFGSDKVVINITNCNHKGTPITFDDMAEVADTGDVNQLIYVYYDNGGSVKYVDYPDHFPTMNVINN